MKRQGIEDFTFDSKAEEWAAWVSSVLENNIPKTQSEKGRYTLMWLYYHWDMPTEPRHSPAQPQNTVGIGVGSGQASKAPVWPLLVLSIGFLIWGAWASGWL